VIILIGAGFDLRFDLLEAMFGAQGRTRTGTPCGGGF
jgi:hypothetical protein